MYPLAFRIRHSLLVAGLALGGTLLRADPVLDSIDEAKNAYENKDYAGAVSALEAAAQLVRQQRAEGMSAFLPEAPKGWTADEANTSAAGAAMMGGMISAQREYRKGDAHAKVQYITDSPMLQAVLMMFNMPMMAGNDGGKMDRIKRQKAIVKYNKESQHGEINIVVGGTLLVTIEGDGVTEVELKSFAEAIDYDKLASAL